MYVRMEYVCAHKKKGFVMSSFFKVLKLVAKYGSKAVQWCRNHVGTVLDWINAGQAIEWIVNKVRRIVGA